jgi:hypothetical protein
LREVCEAVDFVSVLRIAIFSKSEILSFLPEMLKFAIRTAVVEDRKHHGYQSTTHAKITLS